MMHAYLSGLGMGAALIIAIGAQNAFVLVQGIRRNHPMAVGGLCAALDVALIAVGVLGVGALVAASTPLRVAAGAGGAIFLFFFGLNSLRRAFKPHALRLDLSGQSDSLARVLVQTLAITLLNPHVYLDTVVMLGAVSAHYGDERSAFGLGAATASMVWFFSLAQAGKMLAPVFARPRAWQILHVAVCAMVWWVAFGLAVGLWREFPSLFAGTFALVNSFS